jgi:hypothetical protein
MALMEASELLDNLCRRIQECIAPYAGRIEYGNLRSRVDNWDCGSSDPITNVALVYETPGGSTDQINVSYNHRTCLFTLIDAEEGERTTASVDEVLIAITPRIVAIPEKRRETLYGEIKRQIDNGSSHAGLCGHLNRMMRSDFVGGTITLIEMKDAMTFAVHYMKDRNAQPA